MSERTPSPVIPYATPPRRSGRRWLYVWGALLAGAAIWALFGSLGGMRVVGFRYGVFVDNSATICPDQVVAQSDSTITLADGRSFKLGRIDPQILAAELSDAQNMLFVDTAEGLVYKRFRIGYCGFDRPQSCQLITIPLIRKDLPTHGRQFIAPLDRSSTPATAVTSFRPE